MNMAMNTLVVQAGVSRQPLSMCENARKEGLINVCPVYFDMEVVRIHVHEQRNIRHCKNPISTSQ